MYRLSSTRKRQRSKYYKGSRKERKTITPMVHNPQLSATDLEDDRTVPEQVIEGRQVSYLTVLRVA